MEPEMEIEVLQPWLALWCSGSLMKAQRSRTTDAKYDCRHRPRFRRTSKLPGILWVLVEVGPWMCHWELDGELTDANDKNICRENSSTFKHHLLHLPVLPSDLHHAVVHVELHILLSQHLQQQRQQQRSKLRVLQRSVSPPHLHRDSSDFRTQGVLVRHLAAADHSDAGSFVYQIRCDLHTWGNVAKKGNVRKHKMTEDVCRPWLLSSVFVCL